MNVNYLRIIDNLLNADYVKNDSQINSQLLELRSDIQRNFYNVVVVGEFNRGKSTFINALLGKSILPTDILPETATINVIIFNDKPRLSVVTNSGEKEGIANLNFLKKFSAQLINEKFLNQIKYIKIGYPLEFLRNRIVLVDTPGVSDLSEQRTEVTYKFIPKADTVIFVLDATSPLKRTERDFICEHLIPLGITDILFLLNKYDNVDTDEEENLVENVIKRLEKTFTVGGKGKLLKKIECLPVSAVDALKGIEKNDSALIKSSGINEVKKKLREMLTKSRMDEIKQNNFKNRLNLILDSLLKQFKNLHAIKFADSESLQSAIEKLNGMLAEKSRRKSNIENYTAEQKNTICAMTNKSLNFFHHKLKDEILDQIENYNQDNFKIFIEKTITKSVRKNFETWINTYSPAVDKLLAELERAISIGLSRDFNRNIHIKSDKNVSLESGNFSVELTAADISNVNIKAGAVAAAGSIGLMAILGGGILPIIGFAALPFLRKKFLNTELLKVKAEIIPQVEAHMEGLTKQLSINLNEYIDERCNVIVKNAEYAYEKILSDIRVDIQKEIESKKNIGINIKEETAKLQEIIKNIMAIQNSINGKGNF